MSRCHTSVSIPCQTATRALSPSVSCWGVSYSVNQVELWFFAEISYFSQTSEPKFLPKIFSTCFPDSFLDISYATAVTLRYRIAPHAARATGSELGKNKIRTRMPVEKRRGRPWLLVADSNGWCAGYFARFFICHDWQIGAEIRCADCISIFFCPVVQRAIGFVGGGGRGRLGRRREYSGDVVASDSNHCREDGDPGFFSLYGFYGTRRAISSSST